MKKGILLAALLMIAGTVSAADLSSVGTTDVEAVSDYSYARSLSTQQWDSQHQILAGLQFNGGGFGSLAVQAGDTQRVTDFRLNYTTFAATYANGFHVGSLGVVGAVQYADETGDRWFPFAHGQNSSTPVSDATGTVELNAPVFSYAKAFVDYGRTYSWGGNLNSFYANLPTLKYNYETDGAVGVYTSLSAHVGAKVGYARGWGDTKTQGVVASLKYTF